MGFDSPLGDKKKNDEMSATKRHIRILLLLAAGLLAGCVREDPPTPETREEIRLDASVWQMMQGAPSRRVSTYESAPLRASTYNGGTLTSGSFTAAAYVENTTTPYINPVQVNWETDKWVWSDGKHYWPASGSLDFFAYMPATKPGYISSINYAVNGTPAPAPNFVCADFPMTVAGQEDLKEFIWTLTPAQNKAAQGATGVTMNFKHPFALIKFVIASGSGTHVQVNSISIAGLHTGGTCTFNAAGTASTWSGHSGSTTMTITPETPLKYNTESTETILFMVIPKNYGSKYLTVNATWDEWSDVTISDYGTNVDFNWEPGRIYTYNLTLDKYGLKVDVTKFTEQW